MTTPLIAEPADARRRIARLCRTLGIDRPVLLAPMAKIAGGALAGAVSDAGGLGLIGGGYGDLDWLRSEWDRVGTSRVGLGLITWRIDHDLLASALELGPAAMWLSFGDAAFGVDAIKSSGAVAIVQVADRAEALAAVDAGVDVLVAQGTESGGHGRPRQPTLGLVSELAAATDVPIVAAGGITTRADFELAVAAGASGVALGTALYASHEAADVDAAKDRLVTATAADTVRSVVYDRLRGPDWPGGYDGRSLRTEMTRAWDETPDDIAGNLEQLRVDYATAATASDMSIRVVWAGQGVERVDQVVSARQIIERFPMAP